MNKFSKWCVEAKETAPPDRVVIIMRGLSGSGKSHTAKKMLEIYGGGDPADNIFSNDNYWIKDLLADRRRRENLGVPIDQEAEDQIELATYRQNWTGKKLGDAQKWSFDKFKKAVDQWMTPLVVDNQNVLARYMKNYVEYAEKAGYRVIIKEPESDWWRDNRHLLAANPPHQRDKDKLGKFAEFLASNNAHGVNKDVIFRNLQKWQHDLSADDIMGRKN